MHELIATALYLGLLTALMVLRKRLGVFTCVALFFVGTLAWMKLGFVPEIPASAFRIYAALLIIATMIYISSSTAILLEVWTPMRRTILERKRLPLLALALLAIPAAVGWRTYNASLPRAVPPPKIRTVHPAPPATISFMGAGSTEAKVIEIATGSNPLSKLPDAQKAEKIAHGKTVYYENCFYCHGDTLSGDGHYVDGTKPPPPANLMDRTFIPNFTETFLFWRIAKGGPGLPDEATPYDSTMPQWEKFLTEDDIWSVVLFLSDYTGYTPRAPTNAAEGGH